MTSVMTNFLISIVSFIVTVAFAAMVLARWQRKKPPYLLLWGIGLLLYGLGTLVQAYLSAFHWTPGDPTHEFAYRTWYLTGAILTSAWLGQGSLYLLAPRKVANVFMVILGIASAIAVFYMYTVVLKEPEYGKMIAGVNNGGLLTGRDTQTRVAIIPAGPAFSAPFNIFGTLTLAGGALYSAYQFMRKRIMADRMIGNLFIAVGALLPASGGTLNDLHAEGFLYLGILIGAVLMFVGFLKASAPAPKPAMVKQERAVVSR